MGFQFKPATREAAKLLIGLCGPSGSGKTLSALKLATGLGGPIVYIDTEQGRALQYADDFRFLHGILPPPFSPDHYREAVDAAVAAKPNVVIIDSLSHVWEGPGGVLEMVDDAEEDAKAKRAERGYSGEVNKFSLWAKPKQAHQKLVNRLLQIPSHVIVCFRAKEKKALVKNERGKPEVVSLGWHPICEASVVFELTVNVLLSSEKKGVPLVNGFDFGKLPYNMSSILPDGVQISEDTGRRFAEWCKSGAVASKPIEAADTADTAASKEKARALYKSAKAAVADGDFDAAVKAKLEAWPHLDDAGKAAFDALLNPQAEAA